MIVNENRRRKFRKIAIHKTSKSNIVEVQPLNSG